jgi:signal transduction histidine kinase
MNTRRVWTWIVFWVGVCVVIAALSWASVSVNALETRNAEARALAQRQELIQRALWRIDSRIAPIIALESSRPYTDYDQLQSDPLAWMSSAGQIDSDRDDGADQSYATQYFQFGLNDFNRFQRAQLGMSAGAPSSQFGVEPTETDNEQSLMGRTAAEDEPLLQAPKESLKKSETAYDYQARKALADLASQNINTRDVQSAAVEPELAERDDAEDRRARKGFSESASDQERTSDVMMLSDARPSETVTAGAMINRLGVQVGGFEPSWMPDERGEQQLVLVRTIRRDDGSFVQGVWLDWSSLRAELLAQISDIMPGASIVASTSNASDAGYPLATIPASLLPSSAIGLPARSFTPAMIAMLVTWIAILATIAAIGLVLRAALNLSDRRGRFVTAVTHELRTPLTTFRLYAQMLADGMVPDDTVRAQYLGTLKRESERLTGIVENVLEYARLSRRTNAKGKAAGVQTLTADALVVRFRPALSRRTSQSNMDLVSSIDLAGFEDRTVTMDPNAVERIMLNLIENACKYAAVPEGLTPQAAEEFDTRVHLDVSVSDGMLELLVADHGPGIDAADRGRVFGEFQRGSRRRDLDRSGLGLGLALSRGLAREMGGELELVNRRGHGAEFLLRIPLDEPKQGSEG